MSINQTYNEQELLRRLGQDDGEAFQLLLSGYHTICYRVVIDLGMDASIAEDIVQEAFLKVWLGRKRMAEVENFGGWLRTITVNLVYDHITRSRKEKEKTYRWLETLQRSGDLHQYITREESEFEVLLAEAVHQLSPRQQETFNLIKRQGYTRDEAAHIMGISAETVKYHLELAMKTIRAYCLSRLDVATALIIGSLFL